MKPLPYVVMTSTMSLDGYLDDTSETRLLLSTKADFERVDALRATCDAILVGANTIRKDNPRLTVKSKRKQKNRRQPIKVTLSLSGDLDSASQFFTVGESEKIIYTTFSSEKALKDRFASLATIVGIGEQKIELHSLLEDLYARGIQRLLVEGGSVINTQFLQKKLVDELQLSIAGFFVGQKDAPRFVQPGMFPWNNKNRMHLKTVTMHGDIAVLHYLLNT